jgi:hypothetical protein
VIAAEHQGQRAVVERLSHHLMEFLTHLGDVADVPLSFVRRPLRLRDWHREIPFVDNGATELGQLIAETGDPKG